MRVILARATVILAVLVVVAGFTINQYKRDVYQFATDLGAEKAGLSKKSIKISHHNIAYLENSHKGTKPSLLLVHGFGAFKENWIRFAIELKDHFHIVSVDLPGHGDSDFFTDKNYDIDQQVDMLRAFTQETIGHPFAMVGSSMGGAITALYAATYPKDITAAVLIDPGHITDVKSPFLLQVENGINPLIVESKEDFDIMVSFVMEQPPFMPWPMPEVSTLRMAERKHKNEKIWLDITQNQSYDFKSEIKNIKAPTLIAWGKEDRVLHYKNAFIFENLIPNASVKIFENVGHAPMLEIPALSAKVTLDFITQQTL